MGLDLFVQHRRRDKEAKEDVYSELAYFRKVNFLIPWFENWYDEEIENCEPITIDKDACMSLVESCEYVKEHPEKAEEQLPTEGGFFFGSTEYDEYYFDDVDDVIQKFSEDVIPEFDELRENEDIVFQIWY